MVTLVPVNEEFAFRVVAKSSVSAYEFSGNERFLNTGRANGDPFDSLFDGELRAESRYLLRRNLGLVGGVLVNSAVESGAPIADGLRGGGFAGFTYDHSDWLNLLLAAELKSQMGRGGVAISPLIRVIVKLTDRITAQNEGIGLKLTGDVTDDLELLVRAGYNSKKFRLKDRNDGVVERGLIRDRRFRVVGGVKWSVGDRWALRAEAGAVLHHKLRVSNDHGTEIASASYRSPAFFGSLRARYRF